MIGSRGEAAIYPEINEAEHKPPGMYRVTFPRYDSMSEFEEDDAQEEEEEDLHVPPNPSNVPTPGYRPVRDRIWYPPDSPSPEPMELETGDQDNFSQGVLRQEDHPTSESSRVENANSDPNPFR